MDAHSIRLRQIRAIAAWVGLLAGTSAMPAGDPPFADALAECTGCHGAAGISANGDTPHLAGQIEAYLADAMLALQKERWGTSVPWHVPASYSPALVAQLAAHFAALPPADLPAAADPAAVERGSQVYEARCTGCHEDQGRESDRRGLDSPRLAGQQHVYLANQIRDFLAGRRPFRTYMMAQSYKGLSDAQVDDVAWFFAAQPAQALPVQTVPGRRRKALRAAAGE
jgi:cytochrome c553